MRNWSINPIFLCQKHLNGEHVETHMTVGTFKRKLRISGYIKNGLLSPINTRDRHDTLVKEMLRRGYEHNSPLPDYDISYLPIEHRLYEIDQKVSFRELMKRCPTCKERIIKIVNIYLNKRNMLTFENE
jgi:uncharacterized protein with PIN domain